MIASCNSDAGLINSPKTGAFGKFSIVPVSSQKSDFILKDGCLEFKKEATPKRAFVSFDLSSKNISIDSASQSTHHEEELEELEKCSLSFAMISKDIKKK